MNKMKQTAVEWFFKWFNDNPEATHEEGFLSFQKAKELELEQQKFFFECGRNFQLTGEGTFKQVHEEIYGYVHGVPDEVIQHRAADGGGFAGPFHPGD